MVPAPAPLSLEDLVVLDPAVRAELMPPRLPSSLGPDSGRRGLLLVHEALEHAAVLPSGTGLAEFIEGLRTPTPIARVSAGAAALAPAGLAALSAAVTAGRVAALELDVDWAALARAGRTAEENPHRDPRARRRARGRPRRGLPLR